MIYVIVWKKAAMGGFYSTYQNYVFKKRSIGKSNNYQILEDDNTVLATLQEFEFLRYVKHIVKCAMIQQECL